MAVRPPQQDSSEPDTIAFGIAALAPRLDGADVEFPATSAELVETIGATKVPYDAAGNTVTLEEALDAVPRTRFESKSDLLDVLHPVFEEYRASASGSLLGRLRSLLPF